MCYQMPALCVMYKMWSALTGESEVAPVASVHSVHTGALITLVTWHTLATLHWPPGHVTNIPDAGTHTRHWVNQSLHHAPHRILLLLSP